MDLVLTSIPNVTAPCVLTFPDPPYCTCPPYNGPGYYTPYNHGGPWVCRLVLEEAPPPAELVPVPTFSEWAVLVTVVLLAFVGWWRTR